MPFIKNWDNNNWLSSIKYIESVNKFLLKNIKLNSNSKILDIGCGRGKILGFLSSKLSLRNKPLGIDLVNHKDKDSRIKFKKIDALSFIKKNKEKFDLILIKQTIHLLSIADIHRLLFLLKKNLSSTGKIVIFSLDTEKNQLPTFNLMKKKLEKSFKRDRRISKLILKLYPKSINKNFNFKVSITKKKYTEMIKKRFISTLINFDDKKIQNGIKEVNLRYPKNLRFSDRLDCLIL